MNVCVLLSGGVDSVTALHDAASRLTVACALSFDYGSKHNAREISCARRQAGRFGISHTVIDLPFLNEHFRSDLLQSGGEIPDGHYEEESMKRTVVPFRNGILLSIAAGFAESRGMDAVVIAAHTGDHTIYPDCRETFLSAMASAVEAGTWAGIRLLRPFVDMDKAAIVRRGAELGVDYGDTWSCYKGGEMHCGTCGTCVERREAFAAAGVPDPVPYAAAPPLPPKPR